MKVRIHPSFVLVLALSSSAGCTAERSSECSSSEDCRPGTSCVDRICVPSVDASLRDGSTFDDVGAGADAGPCEDITAESRVEEVPVDIIVVADNSGTMSNELMQVRQNVNLFAELIGASGLDYRVVFITAPNDSFAQNGLCIPPPLGTGPPDCTSGPEGRLRAIHRFVFSNNAPEVMLSTYPMYADFLRPDAVKAIIWITDDESRVMADSVRESLAALEPAGMFDRTIHYAIVGYYGDTPSTWSDRRAGSCDSLTAVGLTYLRLATCRTNGDLPIDGCTEGRIARVCETDWRPIFESIASGVIASVPIVCEFDIPPAPRGHELDLDEIAITWRSGETVHTGLARVSDLGACTPTGWYFDDALTPSEIRLCPALCADVRAEAEARIDIALGCFPFLE